MSKKSDFERRLDEVLRLEDESTEYERSYAAIKDIAQSIQHTLAGKSRKMVVTVEPGFQANIGTQLNIVCKIPAKNYSATLFRAYIPPDGTPIHLDFYGEEITDAADRDELKEEVVDYLGRPEVRNQMKVLRDSAGI